VISDQIRDASRFSLSVVFGGSFMDCNHPLDLPPDLEAIRQEHEAFLTKLEALAVHAIASQNWSPVIDFINFQAPETNDL
jgi:hypothetical protein